MIDCRIERDQLRRLNASGVPTDMAAEVGLLVWKLYSACCKSTPEGAAQFKAAVQACMWDDSPVWVPEENIEGIFMAREVRKEEAEET